MNQVFVLIGLIKVDTIKLTLKGYSVQVYFLKWSVYVCIEVLFKAHLRTKELNMIKSLELYLTHYHTLRHFDALKIYSCGKHCEKRRNCL